MSKVDYLLSEDCYINYKRVVDGELDETKYKQMIEQHNRDFIKRKLRELNNYFDHIYDDIDSNVKLDLNQRIAILTDEDYNLIIAGAGSGKTTTMIGKIKYLIEKCNIPSNEILAISFAKKNVLELDEKLNKILRLNVDVKTFHKLGMDILRENDVRKDIISENEKTQIFFSYFEKHLFNNKEELSTMTNFLTEYFNIGSNMDNFNSLDEYQRHICDEELLTLNGSLKNYIVNVTKDRARYKNTILNEFVRSGEELAIANFLYKNGVHYEYEKRYPHRVDGKYYHPDFTINYGENTIYLEHFGINQNGYSNIYSTQERNRYISDIIKKRNTHSKYKTKMIETYSKFNNKLPLLENLKQLLINNGIPLNKLSDEEIYSTLVKTTYRKYFYRYVLLAKEFVSKLKLNEIKYNDLLCFLENDLPLRSKEFIKTIIPIYDLYEKHLYNHSLIDFEDMIIKATKILKDGSFKLEKTYKYLIIDEYQDISKQRFSLIKSLTDHYSSHVVAVGDDWQSIFGFAGSDVSLFTNFQKSLGYAEILKITNTYRNAQELIDIAGEFIQKDENNIKKHLYSNKHIDKPVVVFSYNSYNNSHINKCKAITIAIKEIYEKNENNRILLIGRYGHDMTNLSETGLFKLESGKVKSVEVPFADIEFATVHKSKGLEYDYVIIINAIDATFGFPSKVKDDPIFSVFGEIEENLSYAEERRLFYVALTRTKNKVYIVVPASKPSPFVLELQKNINVEFKDSAVDNYKKYIDSLICPKCGSSLFRKFFNDLDQRVYTCSNDNEICDFMTNDLTYKIPFKACPDCNGFLMFKDVASTGSLIIGCSNYNHEDGCKHIEYINNNRL